MKATPRPLYKWKSFWLGILVLGFLGWSWTHSMNHRDWARYYSGVRISTRRWLEFESGGGSLELRWGNPPQHTGDAGWVTFTQHFSDYRIFPRAGSYSNAAGNLNIELSHWLLILLFLAVWSAWLFFHWKREQRKLA